MTTRFLSETEIALLLTRNSHPIFPIRKDAMLLGKSHVWVLKLLKQLESDGFIRRVEGIPVTTAQGQAVLGITGVTVR
jgi:DNA-binding Lrp family transcriptional regulator